MDTPESSSPEPPIQPEVVRQASPTPRPLAAGSPQVLYLPQTTHPLRRWISWLGWFGCLICLSIIVALVARHRDYLDTSGGVEEKYHSRSTSSRDKVAIVHITGVITTGEGSVKKQINRVREDTGVKAVVLRIDSPGGTITGSDYIYHHLCELKRDRKIPLVVSMGSVAASGGYYIAMAVGDEQRAIFAEPTTTTGSIGVVVPHYDISGLLERFDIKDDSIVSHPRKRMLSMTKSLTDDDRQILESYMQEAFDRFKQIVKNGRPAFRDNEQALNELATGEIFSANQAQRHGLIDEIGFIEGAIDRAAELAGLNPQAVRVVSYKTPLSLFDVLASARANEARSLDWQSLLELSVPRAYYLTTSLPTLAAAP